jgi:hypothetical protein
MSVKFAANYLRDFGHRYCTKKKFKDQIEFKKKLLLQSTVIYEKINIDFMQSEKKNHKF